MLLMKEEGFKRKGRIIMSRHRFSSLLILSCIFLFAFAVSQPTYSQASELDKATALNQQVVELYQQGRYAEAIPIAERVLAIREKALGPDHPAVAQSLYNLAALYDSLGDYAKAEPLIKRSLVIREKALGPNHPDVARSLNNLAVLYNALGDYAKAEPLYKRSLAILEKTYGPDHPDVARSLNSLAVLYGSLGDYARAVPLYKRSLAILEKTLGPNHPDVALSLNNLAELYYSLGDYAKAEPLFKRALAIQEKALGPDHPQVALSLSNLAALYRDLGDYAKAEPLLKRSLTINEKTYGLDHPAVATSLGNLAMLYSDLGDYAKSEPLLKRALAIYEKALRPDHPRVAQSLNNLAALYRDLGDFTKAEPLYKRALAIDEKALGPDHPRVAQSLNNLAALYHDLGDYAKAEPLLKRSLTIKEKTLGPDHPAVATSLGNLGVLYAALADYHKAHDLLKRGQQIDGKLIDQVMGFTAEDQKMKFLSTKRWHLYSFISLIDQYLSANPIIRKDCLDVWLKRKGVVLEAQKRFQEALVYADDPGAMKTFQELSRVRSELSRLTFGGPGKQGMETYNKKKAGLETQKEKLEARLSQLSQSYALKQKIAKADCEKVAKALPKNTALLEFARVEMRNFKATGKEKRWNPAHYLAFVLPAGTGDKVGMIDLGDAEKIDQGIAAFKREIATIRDIKGLKAIEASRKVYDMVFGPLKKELGNVREVFISPDGNLNLIPFEVLQGPDGRFLIEDYTFNYLAAGRDVLGFGEIKEQGGKALLMGDPDFDMGAAEKASMLRKLALKETEQEVVKRSSEMRGLYFSKLPATREEVTLIRTIVGEDKAELYTGKEALEEVLRKRGAPRILHLATHGFFLSDLDLSDLVDEQTRRGIEQVSTLPQPTGKGIKIENPLLRSGIALAGANNALKSGDVKECDGIVTAEKILGLRLRGTDMVVLSACETGMGEVKTGEGVFGLRRAFTQAGTRGLVMSMWAVPDKETKELMVEFYRNIQSGRMNRCQALRQATLKEMKVVQERYGHQNPLFWGAFVFMGEP
jgi:tetratricopeptide (TPR) repeat protein